MDSATIISTVLALIIGVAIGFIGTYWFVLEPRLNEQEQSFQDRLQRRLEELERAHQDRTQAAIMAAQSESQTKIQQLEARLDAQLAESAPPGTATPVQLQTPSISAESPITTPPSARVATPADGSQASPAPTPTAPSTFAAVPTPSAATARDRSAAELTPLQLAAAVRHPDAAYRQRLAIALLESLPEQSPQAARNYVRPLIQLSRDPDVRVRKAAFAALGKVPSKTILPALRRGLRDADSDVVKVANQSMRRFRGVLKTEPKGRAKTRTKRLPRNARPHV